MAALKKSKSKMKTRSKSKSKKSNSAIGKIVSWHKVALSELKEFCDNYDLKLSPMRSNSSSSDDFIHISDGSSEYLIFKDYKSAEFYAIDYVKEMLDSDPDSFSENFIREHIYISDTDVRIMAGEMADSYVDDLVESEPERIIEEGDEDIDKYNNLINSGKKADQKKADSMVRAAADTIRERITDEWTEGLKDPIDFLVNVQGIYSTDDVMKASFIQIDTNEAAADAVNTDGIAHFLAGYDGDEIELPSGYYAYRQN